MNSSHRRSELIRKQSNNNISTLQPAESMYFKKDIVLKDNLALPTLQKSRIPMSLSSALSSKLSIREGLPNVSNNNNSSTSMKSILSPRESNNSSTLRSSAMALLTSSTPSSTTITSMQQYTSPSILPTSNSCANRFSPRINLSNGLLTTTSVKDNANIINLVCDKCDGKHETSQCPYFKKDRDSHPDAQKSFYQKLGSKSNLPGQMLFKSTVVRQPGDGSCLFHSMSYGLGNGDAKKLRAEICAFIINNGDLKICETPLSDWIKWDSSCSVNAYARNMSNASQWGGAIEMAMTSLLKKCNVHIYEKHLNGFKRISAFDYHDNPDQRKTIRVVYQGGIHYDALLV